MHVHKNLRYTLIVLSRLKVHGNGRELTYQCDINVDFFDSHDSRITLIENVKYLVNILMSNHFFHDFRAFNNDCKSRIRVWSDERSISNWSHASKSIQVDCRYAASICSPLRLSISFSFSPLFLWFSASFSRSYSCLLFLPSPLPFRAAVRWNLRNWSREIERISYLLVKNVLIYIRRQVTRL